MKQHISLLLILALLLGLCACGSKPAADNTPVKEETPSTQTQQQEQQAEQESESVQQEVTLEIPETAQPEDETPKITATPVQIGGAIDTENFTMTFDSLEIVEEYSYRVSDYSTMSIYVEDGYKAVLVKGHIENKSMSVISDSSFYRKAVVNDVFEVEDHDVRLSFARDKYFEIDPFTDLDFVMYINIPEKLADMFETVTFTLGFKNDMSLLTTTWHSDGTKEVDYEQVYELTSGTAAGSAAPAPAEPEPPAATPISIGETIVTDEMELTLTNVELTYEVLPPNTSSVYSRYAAESGKVFVHMEADVKNLMTRNISIEELFITSVMYDGKYPYTGFTVVNKGDNSFDWVGSYVAATPLETCKAHGIVECPAEVDTSGKSIVVSFEFGGTTYEYVLR